MTSSPLPERRRPVSLRVWRWGGVALSSLLWIGAAYAYAARPTAAAAMTYFPPWVWALAGVALLMTGWRLQPRFVPKALLLLWAAFLIVFVEEYWSLMNLRQPDPAFAAARSRGEAIRVVTLNCGLGNEGAAAEVEPLNPDILLLQEAPSREFLERLAERLYGQEAGIHTGPDGAILARGRVTPRPVLDEVRTRCVQAAVTLANGSRVEVVSLHLSTPEVRLDLWSPDCWCEQAKIHRRQIREMNAVLAGVENTRETLPLILGGDFNAPAGDRFYRQIPLWYHDAFRENGRGWGNTILNEFPVHRIDQVWVSDRFQTDTVVARKTRNSDHRMVVCDFYLPGPESKDASDGVH